MMMREEYLGEKAQEAAKDPSGRRRKSYFMNMGPAHPAMHGILRLVLELEGEKVLASEVEIGYMHRAFEKHAEAETWNNVIPWTDRLNYVSALIGNVGYVMAVEKLAGIEVPERCKYIRTIACEIARVTDHLTCVGASAMELGAFTVFLYMIKAREWLYQAVDKLTGARVTTSYTRVGGVKSDLPPGFEELIRGIFKQVRETSAEVDALLSKNRIFVDRVSGTGLLPKETALAWGITGPMLRAAGVPYDLRRAQPYLVYDRLEFEVPVGSAGDNYDRYLVRMAEMEQSMRIVEQCFAQLPGGACSLDDRQLIDAGLMADLGKRGETGDIWDKIAAADPTLEGASAPCKRAIDAPAPQYTLPPKEQTYGSIEGLMRHFEIIMWGRGITPPAGEAYHAIEGANGELGFHVVSDGRDKPYRVRHRAPCFHNTAALPAMINGGLISDIVPTFGSINMIAGELER